MNQFSTVLVALDLEAGSDVALARAGQLGHAHGARLLVLHVIDGDVLTDAANDLGLGETELRERTRFQVTAQIDAMVRHSVMADRPEILVEFGVPHEVITRVARDRSAVVTVMGPGRGRSLKDRVLGSTADRVIRLSNTPVLVARKGPARSYRRVAVAVDGSPHSVAALGEVRRLAPDAELQLVHAADIPLAFQQALLRSGTPADEVEQYRSARARRALARFSALHREESEVMGLPVKLVEGEPGPVLLQFAKNEHLDLLALGSHGRGVARQVLVGSVARQVLGGASCDVLVVTASG